MQAQLEDAAPGSAHAMPLNEIPIIETGRDFPLATLRAYTERTHALLDAASRRYPRSALAGLDKVSRALTRFDPAEIAHLSARLLHAMPFAAVAAELEGLGITGPEAEPFWLAVRGNIEKVAEAALWWPVVAGDTVHVEVTITEIRPTSKGGRGLVRTRNEIKNQRGETVIVYTPLRLLKGSKDPE